MAWITALYNGSFNSVGFWEQDVQPGRRTRPAKRAQVAYVHYPNSDDNSRISGGLLHREFELTVAATISNLDDLEDLVDTTHTLVYHGGTVTASLDYCQNRLDTDNDDSGIIVLGFTIT